MPPAAQPGGQRDAADGKAARHAADAGLPRQVVPLHAGERQDVAQVNLIADLQAEGVRRHAQDDDVVIFQVVLPFQHRHLAQVILGRARQQRAVAHLICPLQFDRRQETRVNRHHGRIGPVQDGGDVLNVNVLAGAGLGSGDGDVVLARLALDDLDDLPLQRLDAVIERHQHGGHDQQRQHHDDGAGLVAGETF